MKTTIAINQDIRKSIYRTIKDIPQKDWDIIPIGFNNSVFWNIGHLTVIQQILHYKFSGNPLNVDEDIVEAFKKGTSPSFTQKMSKRFIIDQFLSLIPKLEEDYNKGIFKNYKPYTTSLGTNLIDIETSIEFNNFHEGLHFGTILAIRKFL